MAETFDPKQYDRLLARDPAAAKAYWDRTHATATPSASDLARQAGGAALTKPSLADFKKQDITGLAQDEIAAKAAHTIEPGSKEWEEARTKAGQEATKAALASGLSKSAADAIGLEAYTNYGKMAVSASDLARAAQKPAPKPAEGIADFRKMEQMGVDTGADKAAPTVNEPAQVAASAKELASATPAKVPEVLDKLKEEEAKGGPNFWDIIQAAAAGWGGQVPLYVQRELKRKEAETQLSQAETIAQKQAEISAAERKQAQEDALARIRTEYAERAKLGLNKVAPIAGLDPVEFTGIK